MRRLLVVLSAGLAITACKGDNKPAPEPAPVATPGSGTAAPPAPPTAYVKADLGQVSIDGGTADANDPHLVVDATGRPVVLYKSAGKHHVVRHDGTGWKPVGGGPVACKSEYDRVAISTDPDGAVVVAGTIMNSKGSHFALACIARESAEGWKVLGEPVGDEAATTSGVAVVPALDSQVVILQQRRGEVDSLDVWRFEATAWKPVGDGKAQLTSNVKVPRFQAVRLPDGLAVVRIEDARSTSYASITPWAAKLHADTAKWDILSPITDWDNDSSFELAAAADGTLLLSRTYNPGFKEVLRKPPEGIWSSLGTPGKHDYTAHDIPAIAAGPKGTVVLAWAGAKVEAAIHDGTAWKDVALDVGRKPGIQSATRVAVTPDGKIVLVWRDYDSTTSDPARIYAASFAPPAR